MIIKKSMNGMKFLLVEAVNGYGAGTLGPSSNQ